MSKKYNEIKSLFNDFVAEFACEYLKENPNRCISISEIREEMKLEFFSFIALDDAMKLATTHREDIQAVDGQPIPYFEYKPLSSCVDDKESDPYYELQERLDKLERRLKDVEERLANTAKKAEYAHNRTMRY